MYACVCTLDVPELVDEGACLSDSTSEEHSLSSYTSESFDDNGKSHFPFTPVTACTDSFPLPVDKCSFPLWCVMFKVSKD